MSLITEDDTIQPLRLVGPRAYTLADLWELMKDYITETEKKSRQYQTMDRLCFSAFHEWLKRREKEGK